MQSHFKPNMQTFKAGADLSAKRYCFAKFGAAEDTVVAAGAGEDAIGVVMNAPANGELAEVALFGAGGLVKLAGNVARGEFIKSDANGAGVKAGTAADLANAQAMASGVSGDVVPVMIVKKTI